MTTLYREDVACSVCGATSTQTRIGSTGTFGACDLDFRPSPMQRFTICYWIEQCPDCGYLDSDISEPEQGAKEALRTAAFRDVSRLGLKGELVVKFYRRSVLDELLGDYRSAVHSALQSAWAADDADDQDSAVAARKRAAELAPRALGSSEMDEEQTLAFRVQVLDILRRAGMWDEAKAQSDTFSVSELDEDIGPIIAFQRERIAAHDRACYSADQAYAASNVRSA